MNSLSTVGLLRVKEVQISRLGPSTVLEVDRGLLELRLLEERGLVGSLVGVDSDRGLFKLRLLERGLVESLVGADSDRGVFKLRLLEERGLVRSVVVVDAVEPQRTLSLTSGTRSLPSAPE